MQKLDSSFGRIFFIRFLYFFFFLFQPVYFTSIYNDIKYYAKVEGNHVHSLTKEKPSGRFNEKPVSSIFFN